MVEVGNKWTARRRSQWKVCKVRGTEKVKAKLENVMGRGVEGRIHGSRAAEGNRRWKYEE